MNHSTQLSSFYCDSPLCDFYQTFWDYVYTLFFSFKKFVNPEFTSAEDKSNLLYNCSKRKIILYKMSPGYCSSFLDRLQ